MIMQNRTLTLLPAGLALLALATSNRADDITSGYSQLETLEQSEVKQKLQLDSGFTYIASADFDKSGLGDVSVWRTDVRARYSLELQPGTLSLGAFYEYSDYDLGNLSGDNGNFNTLSFDASWKGMVNDHWGYFGYGALTLSASTDANLGDGLTGTGAGGVRYVASTNLSFGLGLAVSSRLEIGRASGRGRVEISVVAVAL